MMYVTIVKDKLEKNFRVKKIFEITFEFKNED